MINKDQLVGKKEEIVLDNWHEKEPNLLRELDKISKRFGLEVFLYTGSLGLKMVIRKIQTPN